MHILLNNELIEGSAVLIEPQNLITCNPDLAQSYIYLD